LFFLVRYAAIIFIGSSLLLLLAVLKKYIDHTPTGSHILFFYHWLNRCCLFWLSTISTLVVAGSTAFITFLYSAPKVPYQIFGWLKKIAIGKTIFLAFAWTHTFYSSLAACKNRMAIICVCFCFKSFFLYLLYMYFV
jgi:hypothetical protein